MKRGVRRTVNQPQQQQQHQDDINMMEAGTATASAAHTATTSPPLLVASTIGSTAFPLSSLSGNTNSSSNKSKGRHEGDDDQKKENNKNAHKFFRIPRGISTRLPLLEVIAFLHRRLFVALQNAANTTSRYSNIFSGRTLLILYTLLCMYSLKVLYRYQDWVGSTIWMVRFYGRVFGFACTLLAFAVYVTAGCTARMAVQHTRQALQEALEQEGRSRAILDSLYPGNILQQMYADHQLQQNQRSQLLLLSSLQEIPQDLTKCERRAVVAIRSTSTFYNSYIRPLSLFPKVVLLVHTVLCLYLLKVLWVYQNGMAGRTVAVVSVMGATTIYAQATMATLKTMCNIREETQEILTTERYSQVILQSLYPENVLQQMYDELQPEQIMEAQYQIHKEMEHQASLAVNSPEPPPEDPEVLVLVDQKSLGYDSSSRLSPLPLTDDSNLAFKKHDTGNALNTNAHISKRNYNTSTSGLGHSGRNHNHGRSPHHHYSHSNQSSDNNSNANNSGARRRESMNVRRQSMSRRASLASQRRSSISFRRRRSSTGSNKSISSIASSNTKPINERYMHCTVMFADISGFTQWCGSREPCHVFQLLESVFFAFDDLAKTMKVYKIETIGDCYLAVTGLPKPQDDHFSIMARFASQIIHEFNTVMSDLTDVLGDDTASLQLRVGCHSGPVTAGVLRGDKGRFQLFGDTVNTASRMESNGKPGKVQISEDTAKLLASDGKESWYYPREDKIHAKGKGTLQTYWLKEQRLARISRQPSTGASIWMHLEDVMNLQEKRLQEWAVQNLELLLKRIVASSGVSLDFTSTTKVASQLTPILDNSFSSNYSVGSYDSSSFGYREKEESVLEELKARPTFEVPSKPVIPARVDAVEIPPTIAVELKGFIEELCTNYQSNPFHCMLHALHVAQSMVILMEHLSKSNDLLRNDPLAQLSVLLSCLVRDLDNPGVSNQQLMKEDVEMAEYFHRTGATQQNALDVAWELLTGSSCSNLLKAFCSNSQAELDRFRCYMVHGVMATDLEDRDLQYLRFQRWKTADYMTSADRSIVIIEQCMQFSDLLHMVQADEFCSNWTERSFREQYLAYIKGRKDEDPCLTFFGSHLNSFQKDVIPLAERFVEEGKGEGFDDRQCVLGSCPELLRRAKANVNNWKEKGQERVLEMSRSAKYEFGEKPIGDVDVGRNNSDDDEESSDNSKNN